MTPRWIGSALLCVGAVNAVLGTMLAFRSASNNVWPYVIVVSGVVVMICGYFIGKRKSWN
jgi:hypothetical protein